MKEKRKKIVFVLGVIAIVLVSLIVFNYLGIGTFRSAVRIGYMENANSKSWSASYMSLNGSMKRTISPKENQNKLHIEVETEKGEISIEIKDSDNNVIFYKENIGTNNFEVDISGKVSIKILADSHKGNFNITV